MTNRILPIPMGVGPSPSEFYTKAEIDAMLQSYAKLVTTDLVNYYLKSETLTTSEIQALVGQITSFEVVATLPVSDIKTNVIYLLGPTGSGADKYEEYIYSNNTWVKIGETSVDLSNYVTVTQLNTALGFYTPTVQMQGMLDGKQDVLTAGEGITIGTDGTISADIPTLATVATSGSYNDLTDKPNIPVVPTLATVATTGAYNDLTGTPALSTVATSGSYNDLTGTPVLSTVATSGSYDDLSDKPDIPEVMPEYDLFNMSQSDRADLYSEITGYREPQEFLFENRVYYAGYPTVSMLYGQYYVDGNGNLKKTDTRAPAANTIVFGYKPEVRVNDDNGGAEYTGMDYVLLSSDGSIATAYDKIEISGGSGGDGKPYVELAELTTAELEDLYAEIIEDPDAYMNANAVYYNGKPANICFIGQYTADNDGNLVFDDTLAEDTVVFELYTEVGINVTDVHTYYALLFSDGTTSDASTTVEAGTEVAGTNDGTNWTSLTIGTETYDIPQGGGSSNAWYGSQYQFDTLGTYDPDTDYYISEINYNEINGRPNLSVYETKADSQAADQALDVKIAGKMDPIVFVGTAGLPSIGTPLEGVTYAIEGETLPLTFTLADQSTVTYNFVID